MRKLRETKEVLLHILDAQIGMIQNGFICEGENEYEETIEYISQLEGVIKRINIALEIKVYGNDELFCETCGLELVPDEETIFDSFFVCDKCGKLIHL